MQPVLEAIGDALPFAVGVAVSPIPIVAVVLILGTPRARGNSGAFLLGWLVGVLLAGRVLLAVADGARRAADGGGGRTWIAATCIGLGALAFLLALRLLRRRPRRGDAESEVPRWIRAVDTFTPLHSFAVALVLATLNPKNLAIMAGAAAAITGATAEPREQLVALVAVALVALVGPTVPVVVFLVMGDRAPRLLEAMRRWLVRHNAVVLAVVLVLIGAKLLWAGLVALT